MSNKENLPSVKKNLTQSPGRLLESGHKGRVSSGHRACSPSRENRTVSNNERGAVLVASLFAGDLVTVRRSDGTRFTGRAEYDSVRMQWRARRSDGGTEPVVPSAIIDIVRARPSARRLG